MAIRLLFYEPDASGHHFAYLARMLPGFLAISAELCLATTPNAVHSEEFKRCILPFSDRLKIIISCQPPPKRPVARAIHRVCEIIKITRQEKPDHIAIMYADGIWQIFTLLSILGFRAFPKDTTVEGWVYRGDFARPHVDTLKDRIRRRLFQIMAKRKLFDRLNIVHELLYDFAIHSCNENTRMDLAPDPVLITEPLDKHYARAQLGIPLEGRYVVSIGMIDRRKGMDLLIEAFRKYREDHPNNNDRLLLGGPHHKDILGMLDSAPYKSMVENEWIISRDQFLSEIELLTFASSGDLIVAPYPNHSGRSSIILWAAAAERPSLGTEWGCIGHVISKEGLGTVCNVLDRDVFADAISTGLEQPWTDEDIKRVRKYAEFHSIENYQKVSSEWIKKRIMA